MSSSAIILKPGRNQWDSGTPMYCLERFVQKRSSWKSCSQIVIPLTLKQGQVTQLCAKVKVKWWYGPHSLISQSGISWGGGFEENYIHESSAVSSPRCLEQPTSWFPSKPCANVPRIFDVILQFHNQIYFMDIILPSHQFLKNHATTDATPCPILNDRDVFSPFIFSPPYVLGEKMHVSRRNPPQGSVSSIALVQSLSCPL